MSEITDPQRSNRRATAFILAVVFLDMAGLGLIVPVLPRLIEEVGGIALSEAVQVGSWLYASYALAQFLAAPLMGALSDRFGRRPLLLLALAGLCVDYLLYALAPSLAWLFAARITAGICGATPVIANAYIADITVPAQRARAFGWLGAALGLGFVMGPALGGLLGALGPRVPFWVAAGLAGANLIWGFFFLPETLARSKRRAIVWREANPFGVFAVFRRAKGVTRLIVVLGIYAFGSAVYPAIWPFWGIAKFGWSEAVIGLSLAAFGLVWAFFQGVLTGPTVAWLGERRAALLGLTISFVAAAGYGFAGGIGAVILLLIFHGPEGFAQPTLIAMMSRAVPEEEQGALQGGIGALESLAMLVGTLFFAQVFGYFLTDAAPVQSPDAAYFIAALVLALACALFALNKDKTDG
ncbi:DHA1 family tetracycline resistance protein-like MFS transporter [Rhodobacter aestuarii]|uniref:MFS transporter, DHA1 family, tetracycline resistance protein n=1 Tax=Rhodobacter aestuarii TaxID=453582 RepID=A0A1N7P7D5_9RHOB|nr:MFS transporter [Rhodobacter aestuarii]PTV97631.1 DHA1 family tetracycline resistance protein-like MFS transporter [Rhodobacter aestuarii]SIT06359.1 MFS transporter, DHA1 family, tetracycline resistance protein [Rhodobacter aestuarii]